MQKTMPIALGGLRDGRLCPASSNPGRPDDHFGWMLQTQQLRPVLNEILWAVKSIRQSAMASFWSS